MQTGVAHMAAVSLAVGRNDKLNLHPMIGRAHPVTSSDAGYRKVVLRR